MKLFNWFLFAVINLVLLITGSNLKASDGNNPCLAGYDFHVVILGSSTAAGSGPSHPDSTWVNRYRKFLQRINPNNTVTNLAQGGTTTYHIMPDWFNAPAGRPVRNTARNVSEAIRLQADAIIVNMPSNDAANGFSLNEQMFNFSTIVSSADSAGIPVWICTTQPRNFSAAQRQLQMDVRDSILSLFGNMAIDFWSGFADSIGGLDTAYDSGDGVHMNDRAHRILFQRVETRNILSQLVDTLNKPDHFVISLAFADESCGHGLDSTWIEASNLGVAGGYDLPVQWRVEHVLSGQVSISYDTIWGGVNTCETTRSTLLINTSGGGSWLISAHLETVNDSITANDFSDTAILVRKPQPLIKGMNARYCPGDPFEIWASGGDTTIWLDAGGQVIAFGDTLKRGTPTGTDTLYARSVRGPLHYSGELFTHDQSTIDWNGIMFDLVASDTLVVDSLGLRPSQSMPSQVTARWRAGSYKGHEADPAAWSSWGQDSVEVLNVGDLAIASFGTMTLLPGDTLGIYLSMQSGRSLKYRSVGSEVSYSQGPLQLISGSGITQGYSGTYYPRDWSGMVFFHYGFNPFGDCFTDTMLIAEPFEAYLDLGNDTVLPRNASLNLNVPVNITNITWSTGDTTRQLMVDSTFLKHGSDTVLIWVSGIDTNNCYITDSINIVFSGNVGLQDYPAPPFTLFPNPTADYIIINCKRHGKIVIINSAGVVCREYTVSPGLNRFDLNLSNGLYIVMDREQGISNVLQVI